VNRLKEQRLYQEWPGAFRGQWEVLGRDRTSARLGTGGLAERSARWNHLV
jgi:hypothetical protein